MVVIVSQRNCFFAKLPQARLHRLNNISPSRPKWEKTPKYLLCLHTNPLCILIVLHCKYYEPCFIFEMLRNLPKTLKLESNGVRILIQVLFYLPEVVMVGTYFSHKC